MFITFVHSINPVHKYAASQFAGHSYLMIALQPALS